MSNENGPHTLEGRVSSLERTTAQIVTALDNVTVGLGEIKTAMAASRPSIFSMLPVMLAFLTLLGAGAGMFMSVRTDIASLTATDTRREIEVAAFRSEMGLVRQVQWDNLEKSRDFWQQEAMRLRQANGTYTNGEPNDGGGR